MDELEWLKQRFIVYHALHMRKDRLSFRNDQYVIWCSTCDGQAHGQIWRFADEDYICPGRQEYMEVFPCEAANTVWQVVREAH
jgi:hypothetical protein